MHTRRLKIIIIFYLFIYLFVTAIGLTPGGSSTVHICTKPVKIMHNIIQNVQFFNGICSEHVNLIWHYTPCIIFISNYSDQQMHTGRLKIIIIIIYLFICNCNWVDTRWQ
jgi:hypothetical protein